MVIEMSAKIIAKKGRGSTMAANERSFTESRVLHRVSPHYDWNYKKQFQNNEAFL